MKKKPAHGSGYAVCIDNRGYEAALEIGKLYRVIPDKKAEAHGYFRVIDESGEDYGYSKDRFYPLRLPQALKKTLKLASRT